MPSPPMSLGSLLLGDNSDTAEPIMKVEDFWTYYEASTGLTRSLNARLSGSAVTASNRGDGPVSLRGMPRVARRLSWHSSCGPDLAFFSWGTALLFWPLDGFGSLAARSDVESARLFFSKIRRGLWRLGALPVIGAARVRAQAVIRNTSEYIPRTPTNNGKVGSLLNINLDPGRTVDLNFKLEPASGEPPPFRSPLHLEPA